MKKYLFLIISAICMIGCSSDDDTNDIEKLNQETFTDCIVGHKWVYDNPSTNVWEEWNVVAGGVMYYSNSYSVVFEFDNQDVACSYVYNLDNNAFLVTRKDGNLGTTEGVISGWSKFSFTWKLSDGSFTYSQLLETDTLKVDDTFTPIYQTLVGDAAISSYSSHKTDIAEVNSQTGEISAKQTGRTYIDVETDKGTAVVEIVVVKPEVTDLWPDYTNSFGKNLAEIKSEYGSAFYESETSSYFTQNNEYVSFVAFSFSSSTGTAYAASVFLQDNADKQSVLDYLNNKYYYYEKGSDTANNYYAFTNKETLAASNIGITFDVANGLISYIDLTAKR